MATDTIEYTNAIPDAPYYVVTEDSFMSGWGPARGKVNVIVLPCDNYAEALIVEQNALNRRDQKRVRINTTKPRARRHWLISLHTRDDYDAWYTPGYFQRGR